MTDVPDDLPTRPSTPMAIASAGRRAAASPARAGLWVDTAWKVTPSVAQAVARAGYQGVGRYVPLPNNSSAGDITGTEIGCLLDAGLQVLLVQHVRRPPWLPKNENGAADALVACNAALACGYPLGCHLWLDIEGCGGSPGDVATFIDAWAGAVVAAGWLAGLYRGYSSLLSPAEAYARPEVNSYWLAPGQHDVATRGSAIRQGRTLTIAGVEFDEDVVAPDLLGELPVVCSV